MGDVGIEHRAVFLGGWGPSYIFIFSPTYLMQLLDLRKLSRRQYQQTLNKIMKSSQKDAILSKFLSVKKMWCTKAVY